MADACLYLLENYDGPEQVNVGVGEDVSIKDLAHMVADAVGYTGAIEWDTTKPDGTPRKLMDVSKLTALGWKASIGLDEGIRSTVEWFREHQDNFRK
jgi:GDP-L-fucose synthase